MKCAYWPAILVVSLAVTLAQYSGDSLHILSPGVVGASMQLVRNDHSIGRNLIKRLKKRLKQKLKSAGLLQRAARKAESGSITHAKELASVGGFLGSLENRLTYYLLNISVGTPGQIFQVQVDTASSDLWIPGKAIHQRGFESHKSFSFRNLEESFEITYAKDSARGYWGMDTVGIGDASTGLSLKLAVATSTPDPSMGVLGIGPIGSETSPQKYLNLPHQLVKQKLIRRPVYSIYMNDLDSEGGKIIFGGTDTAKYKSLTTIPMTSSSTFNVNMDAVVLNGIKLNSKPINVLLDTGSSFTYLPEKVVRSIAKHFSAVYDEEMGMYLVHEDQLKLSKMGIFFQFNDHSIYMPTRELFWPLSWFSMEPSPYLAMSMLPCSHSLNCNVLGDSFLRNAYVIYDLGRREVHIGQYYASPKSRILTL